MGTAHSIETCSQCDRPAKGVPGSWCELPPRCTHFEFDALHIVSSSLSALGCAALACNSPTYCLHGGGELCKCYSKELYPCTLSVRTPTCALYL